MSFLDYFRNKDNSSAQSAKERLQIIVAHERSARRSKPDYLPALQKDLVKVISKYVDIDSDQVSVALDQNDECAVLELNITLPEEAQQAAHA